jgi:hypothetical protein
MGNRLAPGSEEKLASMKIEVLVVVDDARFRVENTREHVRAVFGEKRICLRLVHERKGANEIKKAAFGCSWTATDFA